MRTPILAALVFAAACGDASPPGFSTGPAITSVSASTSGSSSTGDSKGKVDLPFLIARTGTMKTEQTQLVDGPADDAATPDIDDQVQVVVNPADAAAQVRDVPRVDLVRLVDGHLELEVAGVGSVRTWEIHLYWFVSRPSCGLSVKATTFLRLGGRGTGSATDLEKSPLRDLLRACPFGRFGLFLTRYLDLRLDFPGLPGP